MKVQLQNFQKILSDGFTSSILKSCALGFLLFALQVVLGLFISLPLFNATLVTGLSVLVVAGLEFEKKNWRLYVSVGLAILAYMSFTKLTPWLMSQFPIYDSPRRAIGYTQFFAYPKKSEFLIFTLSMFMVMLIVTVGSVLHWRASPSQSQNEIHRDTEESTKWFSWHLFLYWGLFLLIAWPDWNEVVKQLKNFQHTGLWDQSVFWVWSQAVHKGLLPYVDFWFPYAGSYKMLAPTPDSLLRLFVHEAIVMFFLILGLFRTFENSTHKLAIVLLLLAWAMLDETFLTWHRYLIPSTFCLLIPDFFLKQKVPKIYAVVFGLYCAYVFQYEPNLFFYPVLAVFFFMAYAVLNKRLGLVLKNAYPAIVCLLLGVSVFFVSLYLKNQWSGFVSLYETLGVALEYGGINTDLHRWYQIGHSAQQVSWLAVHILSALGALTLMRFLTQAPEKKLERLGFGLFIFGLTLFPLLQKQLLRPHIIDQIALQTFVGLISMLLLWECFLKQKSKIFFWGALSFIVLSFSYSGSYSYRSLGILLSSVYKMITSQDVLRHSDEIERARNHFYSEASFTEALPNILDEVSRLKELVKDREFFVLGDFSQVYGFLGQTPYFHSTLYERSPIFEQAYTIKELERRKPELVLWRRVPGEENKQLYMDQVPYFLRTPLIFKYVIKNFQWKTRVGDFDVLERHEYPSSEQFWLKSLGRDIDLGYLPALSSFHRAKGCEPHETSHCRIFLKLSVEEKLEPSEKLVLSSESALGSVSLSLSIFGNQQVYLIDWNRIWFSIYLDLNNTNWKASQGSLELVWLTDDPDVLY
ncbi:MAG: hypothetical protein AB7F59_13960 [Bdellovibrionales bacterium]